VVRRGTAARLSTAFGASLELAGKTGTTDNYRDSWFAGYSGNLLTVVWVGRDDNKPVGLTGSSGAMRVWQQIMSRLHLHPTGRIAPDGVEFLDIDASTGLLANDRCEQRMQLPFVAGQGPDLYAGCAGVTGQLKNWFNIRVLPDLDAVRPERKDPEQKSK
jgi:penicillin-binding protein 1B